MSAAVGLRDDFTAADLRRLAGEGEGRQSGAAAAGAGGGLRWDGSRRQAARIGGMDRQTLRDWVHRFNEHGPAGLINIKPTGRRPKLSVEQKEALRQLVEAGPDPEKDGVVRWRCVDLKRVLGDRFGVDLSTVAIGRVLKRLGFSHISARPRHPAQDAQAIAAFKKTSPLLVAEVVNTACAGNADRGLVPGRDARRAEERSGLSVGQERHTTAPAKGSALRKCLSVRRGLSEPRYRGRTHHAECRHRSHAEARRRDRPWLLHPARTR